MSWNSRAITVITLNTQQQHGLKTCKTGQFMHCQFGVQPCEQFKHVDVEGDV